METGEGNREGTRQDSKHQDTKGSKETKVETKQPKQK